MKKRLVFGCGYIGLPVAEQWHAQGDQVFAITRSKENADRFISLGLTPIVADITRPETLDNLPDVETVLFSVGIDRSVTTDVHEVYVEGLANALNRLSNLEQFIYISSTGVYGEQNCSPDSPWIDESVEPIPSTEGGEACVKAEQKLADSMYANQTTIVRSAGIYGPGRIPGLKTVRSGIWSRIRGRGYLNLIHRDDLVRIILILASKEIVKQIYHAADGNPVAREVFYPWLAEQVGVTRVDWENVYKVGVGRYASKRISNEKVIRDLNFEFEHPDYLHGIPALLNGHG